MKLVPLTIVLCVLLQGCCWFHGANLKWHDRFSSVGPDDSTSEIIRVVGKPTHKFRTLRELIESYPEAQVPSLRAPGTREGAPDVPYREYVGRTFYSQLQGHRLHVIFDYSEAWLSDTDDDWEELWEYDAALFFRNEKKYFMSSIYVLAIRGDKVVAKFHYAPVREFGGTARKSSP
jgi:hypothetical protein